MDKALPSVVSTLRVSIPLSCSTLGTYTLNVQHVRYTSSSTEKRPLKKKKTTSLSEARQQHVPTAQQAASAAGKLPTSPASISTSVAQIQRLSAKERHRDGPPSTPPTAATTIASNKGQAVQPVPISRARILARQMALSGARQSLTQPNVTKASHISVDISTPEAVARETEKASSGLYTNFKSVNWIRTPAYHAGDNQVLYLPDGRGQLGWAQYGRSGNKGPAIVMNHGMPSDQYSFHGAVHKWAESHGVRLICPSRGGYQASSLDGNRTIDEFTRNVGYLIDTLAIDTCKIWGGSGGGPFALSLAQYLGKRRVLGTAIMCGAPHPKGKNKAMPFRNRWVEDIASSSPSIARWWIRNMWARRPKNVKTPAELQNHARFKDAYTNDFMNLISPWPFEPEDVHANEIRWVAGNLDINCTYEAAKYTVSRLTNAKAELVPSWESDHHLVPQREYLALLDWLRKL